MRATRFVLPIAFALSCAAAEGTDPADVDPSPSAGELSGTDSKTLVPTHAKVTLEPRRPSDPAKLAELLVEGWGETRDGPGEPPTSRVAPGQPQATPAPGPDRKRLVRLAHVADLQLTDDESPSRLCLADGPPPVEGGFRPAEAYGCRMTNAVVRTINRIHATAPIDLVVLGGDNADNSQQNEIEWVMGLLNGGGPVTCDSGERNDLVPGPDNDPKDPFTPEGLNVPWLWVTGNHDIEVQGNVATVAAQQAMTIGDTSTGGTRDYRLPGGPIVRGQVPADPRRALLQSHEIVARLLADTGVDGKKGHGLGEHAQRRGKAFYTYDMPKTPIRFLVLDLASEIGGAAGLLRKSDIDGYIAPEIARAQRDKKMIILASHHAADALSDGTGAGGLPVEEATTSRDWEKIIATSKPVIMNLVGHAHSFRTRFVGDSRGGAWEVQSDAIADYPNQLRLVEVWDEDNGFITIRASGVDFVTDGDPLAAEARRRAVADFTTGWTGDGLGKREDRNVILWAKKPAYL